MKFEKAFNPIEDFDFEALEDSDFREDSVREEIISPIIKAVGYSTARPFKIIRSKPLKHPFVSVGSARKKITCIPDYLFEVNGEFAWVLEAKGPNENILEGKHVEQAYSYAIHSEIRVPLFALCNGREFALYHISKGEPILHFDMRSLAKYFDNLKKYVSPENVTKADFKLAKDFGLHLKRLGFHEFESLIFPNVPVGFIAQLDPDLFTTGSGIKSEEGDSYVMTFDFGEEILKQLKGKIPDQAIEMLLKREDGHRKNVQFSDGNFHVNIDCRVGHELQENSDEIFLPFIINRVL
ncbi:type I restriction enzyme HsdR N-terminal domain-containing protein [Marinobacter bohaiensis]|uniref:type I restriction enzyme HsdR N-terminal domain-containing protein n=1 Tax=Marinobacter bohaiensis TaxID=2201898 RepID=UPI000DAEB3A7|nr:type I restriction enzyme HsdR N-terminal domain-containing protein [Marinobacter bohaiensis]